MIQQTGGNNCTPIFRSTHLRGGEEDHAVQQQHSSPLPTFFVWYA